MPWRQWAGDAIAGSNPVRGGPGNPSEAGERTLEPALERLTTIPGVGRRTAETLLAEVGADMTRFPSAHHLASWAGMCPGNSESAGKRQSGRTRKGSPWLRSILIDAAHGAARTSTYLGAQYHRLAVRRGGKRAAVAVGHSQLVIAYAVLSSGQPFRDLGATTSTSAIETTSVDASPGDSRSSAMRCLSHTLPDYFRGTHRPTEHLIRRARRGGHLILATHRSSQAAVRPSIQRPVDHQGERRRQHYPIAVVDPRHTE